MLTGFELIGMAWEAYADAYLAGQLAGVADHHVELMDRVLVFREHELFRELDRSELSRNALVGAFFGESGED